MHTGGRKIAFLFCILSLMAPLLYAQNEAIPLIIINLPEKEQLPPAIPLNIPAPILEKEPPPLPQSFIIELIPEINSTKSFFPAYLIPARQSMIFAQSYEKTNKAFLDFIDKKVYTDTLEKRDEKRLLREQWQKFFGIDIWYPYFKAKEVENWIGDKTKVEFFHFKGRMKFENNQLRYTFKAQF